MKYSDLIQFDPVETVVQLREADREEEARRLVETFVISKGLADTLVHLAFSQLQFSKPSDNKGLLVVGNYGTGKSHLMAVISSVCEHPDLAKRLNHSEAAASAGSVAGRFKVIRTEIGSTTMPLREILTGVLERGLEKMGVVYTFPAAGAAHENKSALQQMMGVFQERYPEQGLLLVVDELLEFLRSRKDQELVLDLSFLREVGEVCKDTRFRFMAGVQESLFDSQRFAFAAESLRRVKDRFEQVPIHREDVAFVVAERLLRKSPQQKGRIREHLERFGAYFGAMNERLDDFVRLFPVHPAYLDVFERIAVAEKREVLKTLSGAMRRLLDKSVPTDEPGLIAYDSYWQVLRDNPSFRAVSEIREVLDRSAVLESRIEHAFGRPGYKPAALRLIHALSVHRLTTGDIYSPMGATAEELRDDLCLLLPNVPEKSAEFLRTLIESVLAEILKTVSGQFLTLNRENGQYFLDLKKDIDFDALIAKKAETLDDNQLDRQYFDALRRVVLEDAEAPAYVAGFRIWEHELEWRARKVGRAGYLFFGAPNERSTAQPPRDFYLYFLQPFDPPPYKDEKVADEVFFRLARRDDGFDEPLRLYGGARELAATASGANKKIYEDKALEFLKRLTAWLREKLPTAVDVVYRGVTKSLAEVVKGAVPGGGPPTVRDLVNLAGGLCLAGHFESRSPQYPAFGILITRSNREQAAQEALRWLGGGVKSKQGAEVLDALKLLDGQVVQPRESLYAKQVLGLISAKGQGQVLNRSELVQSEATVEYWMPFRLEPEFLVVVLAALVYSGDLVLSVPGQKFDASGLDALAKTPIRELVEFKHVERPKDLPLAPLQDLFDLLAVPKGLIVNPSTREDAVRELQSAVLKLLERIVLAQERFAVLAFWGSPVFGEAEQQERRATLAKFKRFLESLQPFNTAGKLKNFPHDSKAVKAERSGLAALQEIEQISDLLQQVAPQAAYLGKAQAVLASSHPWGEEAKKARVELLARLTDSQERAKPELRAHLSQVLDGLCASYRRAYLEAHRNARLAASEDKKKGALAKDSRLAQLQKLQAIEVLPAQQLRDLQDRAFSLKTCFTVSEQELGLDPLCPHCQFRPAEEPEQVSGKEVLAWADERLDQLVASWTKTLVDNLDDPTVAANIELLSDRKAQKAVQALHKSRQLPDPLPAELVQALQDVFGGLHKVVVERKKLAEALAGDGTACTVKDFETRFERYVGTLTHGKDTSKVRLIVE